MGPRQEWRRMCMGRGNGKPATDRETQRCRHESSERDRCKYCGAVTAKVCAIHEANDANGCWATLGRYRHADGCRLAASHAGCPAYVPEPESEVDGRSQMVFYPHVDFPKAPYISEESIRNYFEKRGFTVTVEGAEVVIAKGDACERFPKGVFDDSGVFLLYAIHWLKERGHARVERPTTGA
jgi:hypothetical protein